MSGADEARARRFLAALRGQPVDRTPVWIMRQAGRYLPEYREVRARAGDFLTLCKTPELACEVTLQPLRRYPLDAAILFSDILTIPDAMDLGLSFAEGEGPRFARPLRRRADIERLGVPDPQQELGYVLDAARLVRAHLQDAVPLIGFAGSPWTLATYMVEGGSSRDFRHIKSLLYDEPDSLHRLLQTLAEAVLEYTRAQVEAGAQAIMLFDTWGGALADGSYQQFSLAYLERIVQGLAQSAAQVPVIVFTKGGGLWLEQIAATGCAGIGLDWTVNLAEARRRVGARTALQGNLDPAVLHASAAVIREQVAQVLAGFGNGSGHVFNLGHGIDQFVDPARVTALVQAVHELSAPYHTAG